MKTRITFQASRFVRMLAGMLVALALGSASASDIYVSSTGSATAPYENWATAFTSVQAAFDFAQTNAGVANVYLAGETFAAPADGVKVYSFADVADLAIRGGYEANPANPELPGPRDPVQWPTALARSGTAPQGRVLSLSGLSNVTFEHVVIRSGSYGLGGGVNIGTSSGVLFDSCAISNNVAYFNRYNAIGGGFHITGSSVALTNCTVSGNATGSPQDTCYGWGGGAYVGDLAVLSVVDSTFSGNHAYATKNAVAYGGAFYVAAGGSLECRDSLVVDNKATSSTAGSRQGRGGAVYNNGGALRLRNVLIARNTTDIVASTSSGGIYTLGSTATTSLDHCTIVDNDAGKTGATGIRYDAGQIAMTNSIVWGHDVDLINLPADASGTLTGVWYSDVGDGSNAGRQGCHSIDPLFADALHYHLASSAGHYVGGAFGGGSWTTGTVDSPVIDRGDPTSGYSLETAPNGGRVNMGAYGNTVVASRSPTIIATLPAVSNDGAILCGHATALLRGTLVDGGGELPDVTFHYWESGTTVTSTVPVGMRVEGAFDTALSGLSRGASYEYRIAAANGAGTSWSGVSAFSTLPTNATIHVASSGDNTAGTSWGTAFADPIIAFALVESGDTVRIAGEIFAAAPAFGMSYVYRLAGLQDLLIEGGYQATGGTPGARDPAAWPTVLARTTSAANARVLQLESLANVTFDGLTFRDGRWDGGGGARVADSTGVVFKDCSFLSNQGGPANPARGGGLYVGSSTVEASNCLFANNSMYTMYSYNTVQGGGVFLDNNGTLTVRNSIFEGNTVVSGRNNPAEGGAIYVNAGGTLDLHDSIVTNNRVTSNPYGSNAYYSRGGGLANAGGTARLRNVLIARNTSTLTTDPSSGIFSGVAASAFTSLDNCTIASNDVGKAEAVGVRYGAGTLSITNSIVWGHGTNDLSNLPVDGSGHLLNVGWSLFNDATMDGVAGCVSADPLFADPAAGDYRLGEGSPAIDAGLMLPWMAESVDLAGVKRAQGISVDMGAYEVPGPSETFIIVR